MAANETVFFNEGDIAITNARLVVEGQTWAISGITSVKVTEHDSRFGAIVMGIMGFIVLKGGEFVGYGLMLLAVALIWYALGIKYKVMLITSSGELSAVEGRDKDQISRVVNALNSAIIARS